MKIRICYLVIIVVLTIPTASCKKAGDVTYPGVAGNYITQSSDCPFADTTTHSIISQDKGDLNLAFGPSSPTPEIEVTPKEMPESTEGVPTIVVKSSISKEGWLKTTIEYGNSIYNCSGNFIANDINLKCKADLYECSLKLTLSVAE